MHPDFENIEFADIEVDVTPEPTSIDYNEEYHLDGVSDTVRQIYNQIKSELLKTDPFIIFNPQKYYISIRKEKNVAFFATRNKKIRLVVLKPVEETRQEITKHTIKALAPGVQKFWNGPSCAIVLDSTDDLNEIITLLKNLIAKS